MEIPQYPMFEDPKLPNYLSPSMPPRPSNRRPRTLDIPSDTPHRNPPNGSRRVMTGVSQSYSNEEIATTIQGLVETMSSKWSCGNREAKKKLASYIWNAPTTDIDAKQEHHEEKKQFLSPASAMPWDETQESEHRERRHSDEEDGRHEVTITMHMHTPESEDVKDKEFLCMLLQDTEVFTDPTMSQETTLNELPATSTVSIQKIQCINGKKYVKISSPQKGWISCRDSFDVPNLPL